MEMRKNFLKMCISIGSTETIVEYACNKKLCQAQLNYRGDFLDKSLKWKALTYNQIAKSTRSPGNMRNTNQQNATFLIKLNICNRILMSIIFYGSQICSSSIDDYGTSEEIPKKRMQIEFGRN